MPTFATNLTGGQGGVAEAYTDAELERAIRHGVRHDGTLLMVMPTAEYNALTDDDVAALIAALRATPPVDNEIVGRRLGPIGRLVALGRADQLFPALTSIMTPRTGGASSRR